MFSSASKSVMNYHYKLISPSPDTTVVLRFNKYRGKVVEFMVLENNSIKEPTEQKWYKLADYDSKETPLLNQAIMDVLL